MQFSFTCCSICRLHGHQSDRPNRRNNTRNRLSEMHLKWEFVCLLLGLMLMPVRVRGDMDIRPELPEDFPRTTTEATAEPATEPAQTESTAEAATATTTTVVTTTSQATEATEASIPTTPTTTTASTGNSLPPWMSWFWEHAEIESNSEELMCYLKDQQEHSYYPNRCGPTGWRPTTSCYRCCYGYGYSGYAGCSKLHEGRCSSAELWLF